MTSRRLREWPQGLQNPPESTPMTWAIIKKRHTYAHTLHLITQLTTLSLSHYSDLEIQVVLCQIFVLKRLVNRKISFVSQSGTRRTPSWKRDEIRCPLSKPLSTRLRCGQKTWSVELCSLVATGKRRWTSDWSNLHSSTIPSANFRSMLGPWSDPHPATTGLPSHTLKPLYPWSPFTVQHWFRKLYSCETQLATVTPFGCLHLGQWPMTYLMTLSDWTMSCQPWPPRACYGQRVRYK